MAENLLYDLGGLFREVAARFGRVAVLKGFITPEQLQEALQEQKAASGDEPPVLLGQILVRRRWITAPQLVEILQALRQQGEENEDAGVPFGRYRIISEVGRGGMGVIFRAFDPDLKRIVALKILKDEIPSGVRRLKREAVTAGHLHHPGIVSIHEIGEVEGTHYIAMDFVEGETLDRVWKILDVRKRVELLRKVAAAVGHAHQNGVIHRDLKPENVIVKPDGEPVVSDFGLAKMQDASVMLTASGDRMGTPAYMAPEQIEGSRKHIGPWTDVYQLGTMLYELLTGVRPFQAANVTELYGRILRGNPPRPSKIDPKIPRDLDAVCAMALDPDGRRRYPDAIALEKDLSRWLRGEAVRASTAGPITLAWRRIRRHSLGIAAAASALLLVASVAWLAVTLRRKALREESARLLAEADATVQRWRSERYRPPHSLLEARKELNVAVEKLRKRLSLVPDEPAVRAKLGFVLIELGRFEEAVRELREAIRLAPDEGYYPYLVGKAHWGAMLRQRVAVVGEDGAGEVDRGLQERRTNALPFLRRSLELAWKEGSGWERAHARAVALVAEGKWAEAEAASAEMAEKHKAEGGEEGLLLLGASYEYRHEHSEAAKAFERAATRAQSLVEAHLRAAHNLLRSKESSYPAALDHAAQAAEILPDLPEAWTARAAVRVLWANALALQGGDSSALLRPVLDEDLPRALALDPKFAEAWYLQGMALSLQDSVPKQERYSRAVEAYTRALDLDPILDRARLGRGVALRMWAAWAVQQREDPTPLCERSLADLREVQRVLPEWGLPWLEEARILWILSLQHKGTTSAEEWASNSVRCASEAIRRSPKSDAAWALRAQARESLAYARQHRKEDPIPLFADADKDWSRALALAPQSAERLCNRGRTRLGWASYLGMQRVFELEPFERAIEDFAKAVELDPAYSKGWQFLGGSRMASADLMRVKRLDREARIRYAEAAEALTKDLESKEPGPESRWKRGRCRMMKEDYRGALDDFEKALAADPSLEPKLQSWIEQCRTSLKGE